MAPGLTTASYDMLVLHAAWDRDRLLLWGETDSPARAPGPREKTAGRGSAGRTPGRHPFAASSPVLRQGLVAAGVGDVPPAGRRRATAWLPSLVGLPLASNPILGGPAPGRRRPRLAGWKVSVLAARPAQAAELLAVLGRNPVPARGVLTAPDLRFWAELLQLAASLTAREQLLPGLVARGRQWRAVWRPVLAGRDHDSFQAMVQAMPPSARAVSLADDALTTPPERSPAALARACLDLLADHLARTALAEAGVVPKHSRASIHDIWLAALCSASGRMAGKREELQALAEAVAAWTRPLTTLAQAPGRLCLRLEEPEEKAVPARSRRRATASAGRNWHLRYLFQAADDPSLVVPAEKLWKARGKDAALLRRGAHDPRETLLLSLGQAASLFPPIRSSLEQPAPGGCELTARDAHAFLRDAVPLLEQAGFSVLLPSWWTRREGRPRLGLRARVQRLRGTQGSGLSLDSLLQVRWSAALDGQDLSLQDLEALARLKAPLVQVRGRWVEVDPDRLQQALDFLKNKRTARASVAEVARLAVGLGEAPAGLPVEETRAAGELGRLLAALRGESVFGELPPPAGLQGELRPYQLRGYSWLAFLTRYGLGACLADDMGLGKTVQTLALVQRLAEEGGSGPVLLVCPTSVLNNWQKEAERFTPGLKVLLHHGPQRRKGATLRRAAARHALVVTSYTLLQRDAAALTQVRWLGVVLDEAQNIKNPDTKQARAARTMPATFRIALTGTPVENHVGELWSIMEFLNPGLLGSREAFRRRFLVPIQTGSAPEATDELKRRVQPFLLRRVKTDPSILPDLPAREERKVFCGLTREQAGLYAAVLREGEKRLQAADGIERRGVILALLTRLKQVCNHPAHYLADGSGLHGRSGKLERLLEMLEEVLDNGERALIFTQYREMGELLRQAITEAWGREVFFLHGGVRRARRDEMIERFQAADGPPLFLLSLKAGGTGLNLTAANHVFHFDRWWNPAVEDQATDRVHRIGQKRQVLVSKLLCAGTLEERIDSMIEHKRSVAGAVVATGERGLTELSNEQLRTILALDPETVLE